MRGWEKRIYNGDDDGTMAEGEIESTGDGELIHVDQAPSCIIDCTAEELWLLLEYRADFGVLYLMWSASRPILGINIELRNRLCMNRPAVSQANGLAII